MAGQKPSFRLTAKQKNGGDKLEIGAAWPSEKIKGSFGMRLAKAVRKGGPAITGVVLADGEIIDLAGYWLNLDAVTDAPRRDEGGGGSSYGDGNNSDEPPF